VRNEPYWQPIDKGLSLGYRRGLRGGTWYSRQRDAHTKSYRIEQIALADDRQDSNSADVLDYFEAQSRARDRLKTAAADQSESAPELTVAQAAQRYLTWYKEHRKSYYETKTAIVVHILPQFGATPINALQTRVIREWHNHLASRPARIRTGIGQAQRVRHAASTSEEKRARRATANRILTIFKAILNKAFEDELATHDTVWRRVAPFKSVDEPVIRYLTEAECQRLLNAVPPDLRQLIQAALFTGARYGELARLLVRDLDLNRATVYIAASKSGRGRHVPLSPEGRDFFLELVAGRQSTEYLLVRQNGSPWGTNHYIHALKEANRIGAFSPAVTLHELRHTYASHLAQAGVDLLTISKLLGHADTRITSRHYAHLADTTLAAAVQHLPDFSYRGKSPETDKVVSIRKRRPPASK
jgi:integrase